MILNYLGIALNYLILIW